MANYAIGGSFHKANRSLLRIVPLTLPCRYFATRDDFGYITLPILDPGEDYLEVQGVRQASFQIDDQEREFRLLGDDGWTDSVTIGSKLSAQMETFFSKNTEIVAGSVCPTFFGEYSEEFAAFEKSRYDKDSEIYFEMLKEMGRSNGASGNYIYDFCGFNGVVRNYREAVNPEDLTTVSFTVMSRGAPVFGRYDAGSSPISIGQVQSSALPLTPGVREVEVVPADNAGTVAVADDLTATYTSNGTLPLTQLALGSPNGSGYRLETASGVVVPCTVTLAANVVTINPSAALAAASIYRLIIRNGAITQAVDAAGNASPTGRKRPIGGTTVTFRTA